LIPRSLLRGAFIYFYYNNVEEAFHNFNKLELTNDFQFIDPMLITDTSQGKSVIPAIAVPYKKKTNFDECPIEMQSEMVNAINRADKLITIGWKGAEEHFTSLLRINNKIDQVFVVSPRANTNLGGVFSQVREACLNSHGSCSKVAEPLQLEPLRTASGIV
jgi:hypothetical protein